MIRTGKDLRAARLARGMSQGQLARRLAAKFEEPYTLRGIEDAEANGSMLQGWARSQVEAVLEKKEKK